MHEKRKTRGMNRLRKKKCERSIMSKKTKKKKKNTRTQIQKEEEEEEI